MKMKKYYQRKIEILNRKLKKEIREVGRERQAKEEAIKYIYELLKQLGGRAEIRFRDLGRQQGKIICKVRKRNGSIRMWIEYDEERKE